MISDCIHHIHMINKPCLTDQFSSQLQKDHTDIEQEKKISLPVHSLMQEKYPEKRGLYNSQKQNED